MHNLSMKIQIDLQQLLCKATIKVWIFSERIVENKNLHIFQIHIINASTDEFG